MSPDVDSSRTNLLGHLSALRGCLAISCIAVGAGALAAYGFSDHILEVLLRPLLAEVDRVHFFSPHEAVIVRIKTAVFSGLVLTSPVVLWQVWKFASPGFYQREKRFIVPLVLSTTVLFLSGCAFAYGLVMPIAVDFLLGFRTDFMTPLMSVSQYLDFLAGVVLAFGAAFNMPVVIIAMVRMGLLKTSSLRACRPHAVVVIFVLSAVITPPDVISQCMLALPLYLLYEISITLGSILEKKNR